MGINHWTWACFYYFPPGRKFTSSVWIGCDIKEDYVKGNGGELEGSNWHVRKDVEDIHTLREKSNFHGKGRLSQAKPVSFLVGVEANWVMVATILSLRTVEKLSWCCWIHTLPFRFIWGVTDVTCLWAVVLKQQLQSRSHIVENVTGFCFAESSKWIEGQT